MVVFSTLDEDEAVTPLRARISMSSPRLPLNDTSITRATPCSLPANAATAADRSSVWRFSTRWASAARTETAWASRLTVAITRAPPCFANWTA